MKILTLGEYLGRKECPYMRRWVLNLGLFSIRLHHWFRGDDDRYLHDHPWNFLVLVLKGSYWDVTETKAEYLSMGSIFFRKANHSHYVYVQKSCWTLVVTGGIIRRWGFWVRGKWRKANKFFLTIGKHPCG